MVWGEGGNTNIVYIVKTYLEGHKISQHPLKLLSVCNVHYLNTSDCAHSIYGSFIQRGRKELLKKSLKPSQDLNLIMK